MLTLRGGGNGWTDYREFYGTVSYAVTWLQRKSNLHLCSPPVMVLLLCHKRRVPGQNCGLWSLPKDTLMNILQLRRHDWPGVNIDGIELDGGAADPDLEPESSSEEEFIETCKRPERSTFATGAWRDFTIDNGSRSDSAPDTLVHVLHLCLTSDAAYESPPVMPKSILPDQRIP